MAVVATDVERYSDPNAFAKEVNLPLLGVAGLSPVAPGAPLADLLAASAAPGLEPIVENLAQTRQSLTLRSLLLAGFPHDPECFALGLALARAWGRRGLKVAVVDLDAWHPTIDRGPGEPAEGMVDVLEYGCSFQRVAWELVAGSLWAVGPGSHPAEEFRLADHPEWDRAARVFGARADVVIYVAPFLHKPGLTGRLSKRMDGVVLAASVERVSRVELRDAFLELWGSDAPIIGCVAIEPNVAPEPSLAASRLSRAASAVFTAVEEPAPPRSVAAEALAAASVAAEAPPYDAKGAEGGESALVEALEREVRLGAVAAKARASRSADWFWRLLATAAIVLAAVAGWIAFLAPPETRVAGNETRATGDETVLPAPPAAETGPPASTTPGAATPTTPGAAATVPSSGAATKAPPPTATAPPPVVAKAGLGAGLAASPLTAAPPADGKPFRVHVASFRSETKVAPIVRDLRLKGLDAWYEAASDAPGWYRVFVGRFATEDEAKAYASWLLQNRWVERAHAFPSTSR